MQVKWKAGRRLVLVGAPDAPLHISAAGLLIIALNQ